MTLNDSMVSGNTADLGGGISNISDTVSLNGRTVSGNNPDDCVGC